MVIPRKIEKLLDKRAKMAVKLMALNSELDQWLESKGADLADADICDAVTSGCMVYAEPYTAYSIVMDYIENKL